MASLTNDLASPWTEHYRSRSTQQRLLASSRVETTSCPSWLVGTSWGASANTLRTSALALCYSVAEYCCPVWSRSSHIRKVDSQLNSTMRQITGCLRATETQWLPVLANIAPPDLRRKASTDRVLSNTETHPKSKLAWV